MKRSVAIIVILSILLLSVNATLGYSLNHVSLSLDKVKYALGETVLAGVSVHDDLGLPQSNQLAIVQWGAPSGVMLREDHILTGVDGTAQFQLVLNQTGGLGIYEVTAISGNSTAVAYFQVSTARTYALTIIMPNASIPIWVDGIQRSQGNTTLVLPEGSYNLEVPTEYNGLVFHMWLVGSSNQTNPRLTIQLSQDTTLYAIYRANSATQTAISAIWSLWPIIPIALLVIAVVWAWKEGYFDSLF